jgi:hypothetical protein
VLILTFGSPAAAQYFGRNKVRYRSFDFQVLKTEHFDIYYYSSEREGVEVAARLAERWNARLEKVFEHQLTSRQPLILYGSHADFEQTNVIPEELGEGTGGVTEPIRRRIVLPLAGPIGETDHVIGHELVHAFQFDITNQSGRGSAMPALGRLPLWFVEGMAEYLSLGSVDANTAMKLRDALRADRLPSIAELEDPSYFPYQWGHAVMAYIAGRYGDAKVARLLQSAGSQGTVDQAFEAVLGTTSEQLSTDWHDAIRATYAPVMAAAVPVTDGHRLLIGAKGLGTDLNIGPSLSPNGRWIAFLSSRSLFSTDLYVADAATGKIARKLTSTGSDAHFNSIQFIYSAGAWDPESQYIAIATVEQGRAALAIFNARTGRIKRDVVMKDVDEILNPSWAPDGHAIAFTGMRQGLTDLYVYDLRTDTLTPLTRDGFADLHPAWAPDSRRIAFATDRFSSNLESLRIGDFQLAIVEVASGVIESVPALARGKHINPQWAPDGSSLYFIGDPEGVANIYRVSVDSHETEQLTAVSTGISGITPTSPALSVSQATGRLAFSILEHDKYNIYVRDGVEPGGPPQALPIDAAALPPTNRREGLVMPLMASASDGLPAPQTFPSEPYKPKLSPAGFVQPTAGVGVGQFGAAAAGGAAILFSDTLGDHVLATAFQVATGIAGSFSVNDIAVEAAYLNLSRRWNWGLTGGQVPYVTGGWSSTLANSSDGDLVQIDREIIYRQTERSASGVLAYPLDRGRRVEVRGGVSQTSFEQATNTTTWSLTTGAVLSEVKTSAHIASNLNLVTSAVAFVSDNANFGPASPIRGQRYRVEVAPAMGSINFTGVLLDYRRYVMPVSFYTIAGRVMHYGRYGQGGEDGRLYPVYVDSPAFVRGYDGWGYGSVCDVGEPASCLVTGSVSGSRMLVGNLELRFPLLRALGVSRSMYGPVPVEAAVFADTGVAWSAHQRPSILGGTQPGISSAGFAFRLGLGVLVTEFDITRPFDRPAEGWVFGFNLIPGW